MTSVNFNSKKVYEDQIFGRQDILQFFSGESKDYKYVKFRSDVIGTLKVNAWFKIIFDIDQIQNSTAQCNNN